MALLGAAVLAVALADSLTSVGGEIQLPAPARVFLIASAVAVIGVVALAPHQLSRRELLAIGLAGLGGAGALAALADPLVLAIAVLVLGFAFAARPSPRSFAARARGPAFAALLLGLGWSLLSGPGPTWVGRAGALALALGVVASAGLLPFLPDLDGEAPASSSPLVWMSLWGPALALSLPYRLHDLSADEGMVFGAVLVALGLVNLGWGTIGAWATATDQAAWRYSFQADWGLALVGLGLFRPAGMAAAYLGLLGIVLVRMPLYLWARPVLLGAERPRGGHALLIALLAGAAPFAGFPVRLLVLQAASQTAWPLAVPLLLAMLLWIAHAPRLARTLVLPKGRARVAVWLVMGVSVLLGLAPALFRLAAGL